MIKDERGATLLEFTIILPILITILISTFNFSLLAYDILTIEYVASEAARDVITTNRKNIEGRTYPTRIAAVKGEVTYQSSQFGVEIPGEEVFVCRARDNSPEGNPPCAAESSGRANELIVVTIHKVIPLLFGSVPYVYRTQVMAKNGPIVS